MAMQMEGRKSLESDGVTNQGECLVRTATGWARQTASGGRVDAIATLDCADGEEQVGALIGRGPIVPALAGEALTVGERAMSNNVGRLISWAAGGEAVGIVNTAAVADGDIFELACGGSAPSSA